MATLQSPGIGSGLDINSLVEKLIAAERTPLDAQITRREQKATLTISALASLQSALSSFKDALSPLKSQASFTPHKASSGDEDVFTATATGSAAPGTYDVEVIDLAKAHQLISTAFPAGSTAVVGTGTLTISRGASSFNVVIGSTNNTLAGIRDAINAAPDNPGVQATIINETGGSRLILTSTAPGATNTIKVTQSGGDGGLNPLVYNPGVTTNLTPLTPAQNSHIKIAGYDHFATTNSVSDAIDGVTLNLVAESDGAVPLTVSDDTETLVSRVKTFVSEYNKLHDTFNKLGSYNASTKTAAPLLGDALLRGVEDEVNKDLVNPVAGLTGNYTTLSSLGIAKKANGTLALDEDKFTQALNTNRTAVAAIFGSTDGIAARLSAHIDARLAANASFDSRNQVLQKQLVAIQDDKDAVDARMTKLEDTYRKQFTALDTLLSQLQTTSSFLTQQLANLPKPNSG